MVSIHILIPSNNGTWYTRFFHDKRSDRAQSYIIDVDELIKNLRGTRGWKVKVGYNLLREIT